MTTVTTRTLVAALALGRIAFGAGLIGAPERVARGWIGGDAERAPVKVAVRGLGARDVALSAGALAAAAGDGPMRPWLLAAIAGDRVDIGATLAAGDALPRNARVGTLLLAGGSAAAGAALAVAGDR